MKERFIRNHVITQFIAIKNMNLKIIPSGRGGEKNKRKKILPRVISLSNCYEVIIGLISISSMDAHPRYII